MKVIKRIFHFLGGIYLALTLIALAGLTVAAGTFLESATGSHLFAAKWTYGHPFFLLLLCLFFINILFSALRRWPFKMRHLPFLITHFGLLMVIGGTILKNRSGLQGNLSVWEGSGNQHVLLPHTFGLAIEKKEPLSSSTSSDFIFLDTFKRSVYWPPHLPNLKCKIIGYSPHVKEKLETWIKGPHAYITGLPLIEVFPWSKEDPLPKGTISRLTPGPSSLWQILALRTQHVQSAIEQGYLHGMTLCIRAKDHLLEPREIPLQQAIQKPFSYGNGELTTTLDLSFSPANGFASPALHLKWQPQNGNNPDKFTIPLTGQDALYLKPGPLNWREPAFSVDLIRSQPMLCLVEEEQDDVLLLAFDPHGRVHSSSFNPSHLPNLIAYDQGFGGYAVQAVVPFPTFPTGRKHKELADAYALQRQLQEMLVEQPSLAPPLRLLEKACRRAQVGFAETLVQFLTEWHNASSLLFDPDRPLPTSLAKALHDVNWKDASEADQLACQWTSRLFDQLEGSMQPSSNLYTLLEYHQWPLLEDLKKTIQDSKDASPLNVLAGQLSSLIAYLPSLDFPQTLSPEAQAHLLSAYFRIYGIDYRSISPFKGDDKESFDLLETYWRDHPSKNVLTMHQAITIETPLTNRILPADLPIKLEDQCPGIVLEVQENQAKHILALAYDVSGTGLKWPFLQGNYVARFQPRLEKLPYRVRLRQARQVFYPESPQTYSYECDILISEENKEPLAQTLSMNRVYETWDGHRFYLAGVGTSADQSLKQIQLVVNHDPAKYFLTYPGAILVFLGIVLLFWLRPYR